MKITSVSLLAILSAHAEYLVEVFKKMIRNLLLEGLPGFHVALPFGLYKLKKMIV
jgi:hypothetical protein